VKGARNRKAGVVAQAKVMLAAIDTGGAK